MSGKKFSLPPLSPLIGSGLKNYFKVTARGRIRGVYYIKYILTAFIILILSPLRWYDKWYFRHINRVTIHQPLFILGHWRSGTTLLHNLLCQPSEAGFVTTYQTVFTNYLSSARLLKPFMKLIMPQERPGDHVRLHVSYPQEEEFALCNVSPVSYYHFFYFPERRNTYFSENVLFENDVLNRWKKAYDLLLKKALVSMPDASYLVIKNPVNTARAAVIRDLYPDARFIHIYRNPYVVFLSTKKFFRELMPTLWFNPVNESEIETLILDQYINLMDRFYMDKNSQNHLVEVRYEEFEKDPVKMIERIYHELGLKGIEKAKPHFIKYAQSQKKHRKNSYFISRREAQLVEKRWGVYLQRWNYELPENIKISD